MVGGIENLVEQSVATVFPEAQVPVEMRPLLDLKRGHIGSDVCQRIAAQRKESPESIASLLVPDLQTRLSSEVRFDEGFLNFFLAPEEWRLLRIPGSSAVEQPCHTIFISPFVDTLAAGDYLRLFSLACIQVLHVLRMGGTARVYLADRYFLFSSVGELLSFYAETGGRVVERSRGVLAQDQAASVLEDFLETQSAQTATIWLAPRSLRRKQYSNIIQKIPANARIVCPTTGVLTGMDTAGVSRLFVSRPVATLFYIGSDIAAADLDWFVPGSGETSNCVWFASILLERADAIGLDYRNADPVAAAESLEGLTAAEVFGAVRSAQMVRFSRDAALAGAVLQWRCASIQLLESANRLINSPEVRIALKSGTISRQHQNIITGVLKSVSDMMGLWSEE